MPHDATSRAILGALLLAFASCGSEQSQDDALPESPTASTSGAAERAAVPDDPAPAGTSQPSVAAAPSRVAPTSPAKGPLFEELTSWSGLDFVHDPGREGNRELPETLGGGGAFLDWNRDGSLDLYLAQSGPLRQLPDEQPVDRGAAANQLWSGDGSGRLQLAEGLAADLGYGQGVHAADLDGDGWSDLVALNWGPNGVWRNRAGADGGGFADVTQAWGFGSDEGWAVSAAVFDFDADGDLDLYVVNYLEVAPRAHLDRRYHSAAPGPHKGYPHPDRYPAQADQLWRNDLDRPEDSGAAGRFLEVSTAMGLAGVDPQKGLGAIPTDIELDGWVDLYVANDATPNMLLHNQGGASFVEAGRKLGLAYNESGDTEAGMGVDTVDVDRDGDLDLFVTNLDMETNSLYLNRSFERANRAGIEAPVKPGRLSFRDRTLRTGMAQPSRGRVGFGVQFSDFDLDGDPDCLVVNGHVVDNIEEISDTRLYAQPNQIYLNDASGRFEEAGPELLPAGFRDPDVSRGSALGDLDGDLDLDLYVGNNGQAARLYRATPPELPRLALRLVGPGRNVDGLGASIWLRFEDAPTWLGRMERSRSYASSSEPLVVVGMPARLLEVELLWPGGRRELFDALDDELCTAGGALVLSFGSGRER